MTSGRRLPLTPLKNDPEPRSAPRRTRELRFIYPLMPRRYYHFFYSRALRFPAMCLPLLLLKTFRRPCVNAQVPDILQVSRYHRRRSLWNSRLRSSLHAALSGFALVRPYLLSFLKELRINKVPRAACAHFEKRSSTTLTRKFVFHRMRDIPGV